MVQKVPNCAAKPYLSLMPSPSFDTWMSLPTQADSGDIVVNGATIPMLPKDYQLTATLNGLTAVTTFKLEIQDPCKITTINGMTFENPVIITLP